MHSFMTINEVDSSGKILRYDAFNDGDLTQVEIKAQERVAELHEMGLNDAFYINQKDYIHDDVEPCQGIQYIDVDVENKTVIFNVAAYDTDNFNKAMNKLREQRNERLLASDVIVLPDRWAAMNDDTKTNWANYRQALRDLPANTTDPTNITWPEEPA